MITWNRNKEHEGLQLQSDRKPAQDIIDKLKANGFRWSRRQRIWYAKETPSRVEFLNSIATYEGEIGESLSIAEKIECKVERANARAEYFDEKAEKANVEANALLERAHKMADVIPLGQPILIGHHSEKGDRRYRARIDSTYEKAFEVNNKAKYFEERARISSRLEDRIFNVGTTLRRIEKLEAEWRVHYRTLETHEKYKQMGLSDGKISRVYLEHEEEKMQTIEEEIAYWKAKIEESGKRVWTPGDFKKGDKIKTRFGIAEVLKVNKKTVKVHFFEYPADSWEQSADFSKVPFNELPQNCKLGA